MESSTTTLDPNFKILFEQSPGLYLVLLPDAKFTITAVSDAYLKATLTERSKVCGKGLFEIFPDNPDDPHATGVANLRASILRAIDNKMTDAMAVQKYDIRIPGSEEFEARYWSPANTPLFGPHNEVIYIIHSVQDVTEFLKLKEQENKQTELTERLKTSSEQKEAEIFLRGQQLQAANEKLRQNEDHMKEMDTLKTHFFSNVSHELRTPLSLILGPANLMAQEEKLTERGQRNIEVITRNAQTLLKHVNDLLDIAKLDEKKLSPTYTNSDITKVVKLLMSNFEGIARERGITLTAKLPTSLNAQIDPDMISRVLLNLLGNAFKFTPDRGHIEIRIEAQGENLCCEVEDNGPGVPENFREAIFERFRQVDGSLARKYGGTGLGLSIAKEFVSLHHGRIEVKAAVPHGALFVFQLPLKAPWGSVIFTNESLPNIKPPLLSTDMQPKLARHLSKHGRTGKMPILVVEDNPDLNQFLVSLLEPMYDVETAFDGQEGLTKAKSFKPDLILSDIMMPQMSGSEMLQAIRTTPEIKDTPVILLTAKADDLDRLQLLRSGAQDYVVKPFIAEEVLARVQNLMMMKRVQELSNVEALLQNALDAVIGIDARGFITQWNLQAEKTFGWSKSEAKGRRMIDLIIPENHRKDLEEVFERFLAAGSDSFFNAGIEFKGTTKGHGEIPVEGSITPIRTKDSYVFYGFFRDISERRKTLEDLRQAKDAAEASNRAKSAFLANMSHEIRTPLGAIMGFSEFIAEDACSPEEKEEFVQSIKRNGALLTGILNDVLDLSKVEADKLDVHYKETNLTEILGDVVAATDTKAQEKAIIVSVHYNNLIPKTIRTDPLRLKQILLNMLGNAIKFTKNGTVDIYIELLRNPKSGSLLSFAIKDTGMGIAPEDSEELFRPFSQVDPTLTRQYGGTGLGLLLSKRLAKLLGGDVTLTRSEKNVGSTFTVTIDPGPVMAQAAAPTLRLTKSNEQEVRLDGIKVLLAEDAPDNQRMITRLLRMAGAEVDVADNGKIALEKMRQTKYDVLLLDIQMPVMDGYATIAELRKTGNNVPVIAITAHALIEEKQRSLSSGFSEHISKPIDRSLLINSIAQFCRAV